MSHIVIVNGPSYATPYVKLAQDLNLEITTDKHMVSRDPGKVSLVVFTGGADVQAKLYEETQHKKGFLEPSRDSEELDIFESVRDAGIPMAGICRGAQFLCAMAGGKVVQDITGHGSLNHDIVISMPDESLRVVEVTSSHHQMQYPFDMPPEDYEIVGWGSEQLSRHYIMNNEKTVKRGEGDTDLKSEPDIIWYPGIKAFGVQYHPEWMSSGSEGFKVYEELLDHYIKPEIISHEQNRKVSSKASS